MRDSSTEALARQGVALCGNCAQCRDMMDDAPCPYFPRLYALHDRARAGGPAASSDELAALVDLCNACDQCPCQAVQVGIRRAKAAFVARDGLPLRTRLVEDVPLLGRLCGTLPALANRVLDTPPLARLAKRALGLHPDRRLPRVPLERFDAWAKRRGLDRRPDGDGRKVAYFAGCTARYLFPEVAKATVAVLEANGIAVHVPDQTCCGMPPYLEGDWPLALKRLGATLATLDACVAAGFDIVTACPTCGHMLKSGLGRGAQYAPAWRAHVLALADAEGGDAARVVARLEAEARAPTGRANAVSEDFRRLWVVNQILGRRHHGETDIGAFAELDPLARIRVASHVWELGEYLRALDAEGGFRPPAAAPEGKLAYFAPCHLREQRIGTPWLDLLGRSAGAEIAAVGDLYDCCGLGGTMGLKAETHALSLAVGAGLMARVRAAAPDGIATDCLGCHIQFEQMLPIPVSHPVELLARAYAADAASAGVKPSAARR